MTVVRHYWLTKTFHDRFMRGALIVPVAAGLALAGCANANKAKTLDTQTTSALPPPPMTPEDFDKAVQYWGDRYESGAQEKEVALNYAAALRRTGRTDQAVAVLQRAAIHFPEDREVLAAYGKALAADGKLQQALDAVQRAQTPDKPDWKLLSAEAAILDQLGQHSQARQLYVRALDLAPNDPTVLSNYAMSYVLTNELSEAERLLKKAIAAPGADSRVRQNLALVVGLQGRFAEAERIAGEELSPEQAAANMAYLRRMLSEQDSWQMLKAETVPAG